MSRINALYYFNMDILIGFHPYFIGLNRHKTICEMHIYILNVSQYHKYVFERCLAEMKFIILGTHCMWICDVFSQLQD